MILFHQHSEENRFKENRLVFEKGAPEPSTEAQAEAAIDEGAEASKAEKTAKGSDWVPTDWDIVDPWAKQREAKEAAEKAVKENLAKLAELGEGKEYDVQELLRPHQEKVQEFLRTHKSYEKGQWHQWNDDFAAALGIEPAQAESIISGIQRKLIKDLNLRGDRHAVPDGKMGEYTATLLDFVINMTNSDRPELSRKGDGRLAALLKGKGGVTFEEGEVVEGERPKGPEYAMNDIVYPWPGQPEEGSEDLTEKKKALATNYSELIGPKAGAQDVYAKIEGDLAELVEDPSSSDQLITAMNTLVEQGKLTREEYDGLFSEKTA